MFELWFKFLSFFKSKFFMSDKESSLLSPDFNFKKWILFLIIVTVLSLFVILTFRLFSITANYIQYKENTQKELSICKAKEALIITRDFNYASTNSKYSVENNALDKKDVALDLLNKELLSKILNDKTPISDDKKILAELISLSALTDVHNSLSLKNNKEINQKLQIIENTLIKLEKIK